MAITTVDLGCVLGPQGPQGETGPQGAQGETGAQGPAGPNQVTTGTATNITGLLKGDGSAVSAAVAGTDYATPAQVSAKLDKTGGTVSGSLLPSTGLESLGGSEGNLQWMNVYGKVGVFGTLLLGANKNQVAEDNFDEITNERYVRFYNGFQVCFGSTDLTIDATTPFENVYYGTVTPNIRFKKNFTNLSYFGISFEDNDFMSVVIMDKDDSSINGYTGRICAYSPAPAAKQIDFSYLAVGRWK